MLYGEQGKQGIIYPYPCVKNKNSGEKPGALKIKLPANVPGSCTLGGSTIAWVQPQRRLPLFPLKSGAVGEGSLITLADTGFSGRRQSFTCPGMRLFKVLEVKTNTGICPETNEVSKALKNRDNV